MILFDSIWKLGVQTRYQLLIAYADTVAFSHDAANRFMIVADVVPILMAYVDTNCVYRFVNRAYERWFGVARESIIGRKVKEVVGARAWAKIRPELRKALQGEKAGYESLLDYKDAGQRFVAVSYIPDHDAKGLIRGVVAWVEDITEKRAAEAAKRREYAFTATLLKTTAALIVVLDREGKIVHLNRAFEQATGFSGREVA